MGALLRAATLTEAATTASDVGQIPNNVIWMSLLSRKAISLRTNSFIEIILCTIENN
jgi:hypothetical protein